MSVSYKLIVYTVYFLEGEIRNLCAALSLCCHSMVVASLSLQAQSLT